MKNRTLTVTVAAQRDAVFSFLARAENLTVWAADTFQAAWHDGAQFKVRTPIGEQHVALVADARTGVIDLLMGEQPDEMTLWPLRVLSTPHGAVITATSFQAPGQPDEFFEHLGRAWQADLRRLQARFGGGGVEATPGDDVAFYPGIVTANFYGTWDFYCEHLGFRTVAECDFYVQLAHPSGAQISILRHELDGPAPELVSATDGRGFWLNLEVADADAEFRRLSAAGLEIVSPPEDKPWGDRMFVVRDPNRVLITLSHRIPSNAPLDTRPAAL